MENSLGSLARFFLALLYNPRNYHNQHVFFKLIFLGRRIKKDPIIPLAHGNYLVLDKEQVRSGRDPLVFED